METRIKLPATSFKITEATARELWIIFRKDPEAGRIISEDPPIIAAEIIHGIREEMAITLSDVVFRRTDLGQFQCPPIQSLQAAAKVMAEEQGWNDQRTQEEIREVLDVYQPLNNF